MSKWTSAAFAVSSVTVHTDDLLRIAELVAQYHDLRAVEGFVVELVIRASCEAANLTVLHYDLDFDQIAAVTGQRSEWALPAGSID